MTKKTSVSSASNKNHKHQAALARSQIGTLINRADLETITGGADWRKPAPPIGTLADW